jgi:hypothetical protein
MMETAMCPCDWSLNKWRESPSPEICITCECNTFSEYNPTVEELLFNQKAIGMYND